MSNVISLGLIEVRGYVGAVAVADVGLKAAMVHLHGIMRTRGGLETVMFVGEVAEVTAAVDAGRTIASQLHCLLSSDVIARLDQQLMFFRSKAKKEQVKTITPKNEKTSSTQQSTLDQNKVDKQKQFKVPTKQYKTDALTLRHKLERMRLTELKKKAKKMKIKLPNKTIAKATKRQLIAAMMREFTRRDVN